MSDSPLKICKQGVICPIDKQFFMQKSIFVVAAVALAMAGCNKVPVYETGENLTVVKQEGLCGLADVEGNQIVPCEYEEIIKQDSVFIGKKNGKYGIADYSNQVLIDFANDRIRYRLGEGNTISTIERDGKFAIMNQYHQQVTDFVYDNAAFAATSEGLVTLRQDSLWGAIDGLSGRVLIPFEYPYLGSFQQGRCMVQDKSQKYGFINRENELVIPIRYERVGQFSEGSCVVNVAREYVLTINGRVRKQYAGVIDTLGNFQLEPKFGAMATRGSEQAFSEGVCAMCCADRRVLFTDLLGYIDHSGKWVIEPQYHEARKFRQGVAIVRKDSCYFAIDREGTPIVEGPYVSASRNDSLLTFETKDHVRHTFNLKGEEQ